MCAKRVLVTGGAGFIGSNVTEYLLEQGYWVRVVDNLSTGRLENLKHFFDHSRFEFMKGDLVSPSIAYAATETMDVVVHLAALGSVPRSVKTPHVTFYNNVQAFMNTIHAAKKNGIKRFVYASSSSVYGIHAYHDNVEGQEGTLQSPYALSKAMDEEIGEMWSRLYGMEAIGLRFFNVFGKRQVLQGEYSAVVPIFINRVLQRSPVFIYGDGCQSRDFTHVDNVVHAIELAMTTTRSDAFGTAVNVGLGQSTSVNDLLQEIDAIVLQETGNKEMKEMVVNHVEERNGDVRNSRANTQRLRSLLGFTPQTSFKNGLTKTIRWWMEKHDTTNE